MYLVIYHIIGYRKKVVSQNINRAFPDKSASERKDIIKRFYGHFCDLVVESIKNFSISKEEISKRVTFENVELMDQIHDSGKSVVTIGGHYGNWEMYAVAVGEVTKHAQLAIYKPLSNKFMDKKMRASREIYGLKMIPMKSTKDYFMDTSGRLKSITFGSDQWPSNAKNAHWTKFFNIDTPFFYGGEKYAKEFDWPVVYVDLYRVKRGHYRCKYHLLTLEPNSLPGGEIIDQFVQRLEQTINVDPAYWLWSHKRWKGTKEEIFGA